MAKNFRMGRARQRKTHQIKYQGLQNVGFRFALPNLRTKVADNYIRSSLIPLATY